MTADLMLYEVKDAIATITIDRPRKRNAMIPSMMLADACSFMLVATLFSKSLSLYSDSE